MPPSRLLGRAREPTLIVQKDPGGGGSLAFPTPGLFWSLGGFPSSTGVSVSPLTSLQVATVYGCVKSRSEDLAKVPLLMQRTMPKGGSEVIDDHPIARLLRRPNDWMSPFAFKRFIEQSVCFRGNAYVVIQRGRGGEPRALIPVVPDKVQVEVTPNGILFYRIAHPLLAPNGEQIQLHQDNVIHVRNMGMDAGYMGMSPIAAAQEVIGLALAAQQHGAVLFRQGAQMSGVLSHPGVLSTQAKDDISRNFAERFQGVQNAHKVPVLEEGMTYEKVQMTNEESQFLEARKFQRSEICAIFRVPPHKVMDLQGVTYGSMELSEQAYINDALVPDAEQISQEFSNKILFEDERETFSFNWQWDVLLKADRKTRYEAHAIGLTNGFLSQNDVRRREGEPLIESPEADIYARPLNIGIVGGDGGAGGPGGAVGGPAATGAPGATGRNPVPAADKPKPA